jgi:hypothetical protein
MMKKLGIFAFIILFYSTDQIVLKISPTLLSELIKRQFKIHFHLKNALIVLSNARWSKDSFRSDGLMYKKPASCNKKE